jgi:hypothetical protein
MMTPTEIEEAYHDQLRRGFPYDDCRYLKKKHGVDSEAFSADLEHYWADISGFASSATRLTRRSQLQILWGTESLSRSFFERYPQYADLQDLITPQKTPRLWEQMQAYEEERKSLIFLLDRALWVR